MLRLLLSLLAVCALGFALLLPATADNHEGGVQAFVTPKLIAITVDPTSVDYLTAELGNNDVRPTPAGFTVTNVGSVNVDLQISGADTQNVSDSSPGWTLGASPGIDTYVHRFTINPTPTLADFAALTTSPQAFASNVVAETGTIDVFLSLAMPTESTTLDQQQTSVTVLATES